MTLRHFLTLLTLTLLSGPASAELALSIQRGKIAPTPIALVPYSGDDTAQQDLSEVTKVVVQDLKNTGLYHIISPEKFIQRGDSLAAGLHFSEWRLIKANKVVTLKHTLMENGDVRIEVRIHDSIRERQTHGRAIRSTPANLRRLAHKISDFIYEATTGDPGYFDTQITYVAYEEKQQQRRERLAIMDYDGYNQHYISDGANLVMTPRFSPDRRLITYLDYKDQKPRVYIYDRFKNTRKLVGNFPGMTFAPRFSPDGKRLVMSFSKNGNTSLFEMNLETKTMRRLTNDPVIDTSPSYAPDGTKIVFNSDRMGRTHLFVLDLNRGEPERISFGEGSYRTPVWSPRGDWIAFTKIFRGEFYIGVIRPDGTGERLITRGFLVESPCWSPNGHAILFTRDDRQGTPRLHAIDFTGYNERLINTPHNAVQGDWSMLR